MVLQHLARYHDCWTLVLQHLADIAKNSAAAVHLPDSFGREKVQDLVLFRTDSYRFYSCRSILLLHLESPVEYL